MSSKRFPEALVQKFRSWVPSIERSTGSRVELLVGNSDLTVVARWHNKSGEDFTHSKVFTSFELKGLPCVPVKKFIQEVLFKRGIL